MDLKIEFTDKELTPWAGISLLKNMTDRMGFESFLKGLDLPLQGSNRGLLILFSFFWMRRKQRTVNYAIYERQIKST